MKTVGIIGGMGPLATVDLMSKIIRLTPASKDQDHIHMIVDNYPQIPDRTSAIMGSGDDPLPYIEKSAKTVERAGAELIVIACNTAHYYLRAIRAATRVPFLDMPSETAQFICREGFGTISLFATDGTLKTKLYQTALAASGIAVLEPDPEEQAEVMGGIYAVKAGDLAEGRRRLLNVSRSMSQKGAEAAIAGCTEIPLVLSPEEAGIRVVDPTRILAQAVVELACGRNAVRSFQSNEGST